MGKAVIHKKSLGNNMPKLLKCIYYAVVLFGNAIWNKIPSWHLRKKSYQLLGGKIGKNTKDIPSYVIWRCAC